MLTACIEARQAAVIHNGHLDGVVALGNPIFSVYIKKHLAIESCKALTLASTCQNKILGGVKGLVKYNIDVGRCQRPKGRIRKTVILTTRVQKNIVVQFKIAVIPYPFCFHRV